MSSKIYSAFIFCLLSVAAQAQNHTAASPSQAAFQSLDNGYFVKNMVKLNANTTVLTFSSQQKTDAYFGYGAVQGRTFTKIDFTKNRVIAIIHATSNQQIDFSIDTAYVTQQQFIIKYQELVHPETLSFTSTAFKAIVLSKINKKNVPYLHNKKQPIKYY